MSSLSITKQSIIVPSKITVTLEKSKLIFEGPLGKICLDLTQHDNLGDCFFSIEPLETGQHLLSFSTTKKKSKVFLNAFKSLIAQYFTGLTQGFLVSLECVGIGYRVQLQQGILQFKLGFSHSSEFYIPEDVKAFLPKPNVICFFGIDKKRLHKIASEVQSLKFPDVYKGKGLRLFNVNLRFKEGKKK
jgi:large subunit ribosomal protein L6